MEEEIFKVYMLRIFNDDAVGQKGDPASPVVLARYKGDPGLPGMPGEPGLGGLEGPPGKLSMKSSSKPVILAVTLNVNLLSKTT